VADLQETLGELRDVVQSHDEVLSEVGILLLVLKASDDQLNDSGLSLLVDLVHDLLLAVEVDGAAHDDE